MDSGSLPQLLLLIICVSLSGFFSMSETALMSLSKIRLRTMVDEGVKNASLIKSVLDDQKKLLSSILIGNNIVNIASSSIATKLAIDICNHYHIPSASGIGVVTGIMTIIILIFGEITPKTYATEKCEKVCVNIIKPIKFCTVIFTPFVSILNVVTGAMLKAAGIDNSSKAPAITEAELITMVNMGHEEGVLEKDEREIINNVVDFGNSAISDVMIPRTDVEAVPIDVSYDEIISIFKEKKFSRLPVYDQSIDNIVGIISYKDFVYEDKADFSAEKYMKEPYFTYESKSSREIFAFMKLNRMSMVIVLDEYGGTSGIVTIIDLLEEIVGDISDEYDSQEQDIEVIREDEYVVDGSTKIDDFNEMIGTDFQSEDFDSIGGYVIGMLGRFPEKGEEVESGDICFKVEDVCKNRIEKLRVIIQK